MSAIAGVVHLDGSRPDADEVVAMLAAMPERSPDGTRIAEAPGAVFGFGLMATVPDAQAERLPKGDAVLVTADARVDNRGDLLGPLGLGDVPDGDIVVAAVHRWGAGAVRDVVGDYAWAAWRPERRRLLLVRDFLGMRPLFYFQSGNRVAFASTLAGLLALPWAPRSPSVERVLEWRTGQWGIRDGSFVEGIQRAPGGHTVTIGPAGAVVSRYWDPARFAVNHDMSMGEATAGVRRHFLEAVKARTRVQGRLASHLSGGLDSSSVVAAMHHLDPDARIDAYTEVFRQEDHPHEVPFARSAAQHTGATLHEIPADDFHAWWRLEDRVNWNQGPLLSLHACYITGMNAAAGADGVRVMLDGSEGDATIGHGVLHLMDQLRTLRWVAAARTVAEMKTAYGAKARHRLWQFGIRPALQRAYARRSLRQFKQGRGALMAESHAGGPPSAELAPWLTNHVLTRPVVFGQSNRSDAQYHLRSFTGTVLDELGTFLDHTYAGLAMEHRSPYFDRRLVEFCLSVPSRHRLVGQHNRTYFRRAMAPDLPPDVAWRPTKTPFSKVFNHGVRRFPPELDEGELARWQWDELPGLFPEHLNHHPVVVLRKRVLQLSLAWLEAR